MAPFNINVTWDRTRLEPVKDRSLTECATLTLLMKNLLRFNGIVYRHSNTSTFFVIIENKWVSRIFFICPVFLLSITKISKWNKIISETFQVQRNEKKRNVDSDIYLNWRKKLFWEDYRRCGYYENPSLEGFEIFQMHLSPYASHVFETSNITIRICLIARKISWDLLDIKAV